MLMVMIITGNVDDETEAHRILAYLDDVIDQHPEDNLRISCEAKQMITND